MENNKMSILDLIMDNDNKRELKEFKKADETSDKVYELLKDLNATQMKSAVTFAVKNWCKDHDDDCVGVLLDATHAALMAQRSIERINTIVDKLKAFKGDKEHE